VVVTGAWIETHSASDCLSVRHASHAPVLECLLRLLDFIVRNVGRAGRPGGVMTPARPGSNGGGAYRSSDDEWRVDAAISPINNTSTALADIRGGNAI